MTRMVDHGVFGAAVVASAAFGECEEEVGKAVGSAHGGVQLRFKEARERATCPRHMERGTIAQRWFRATREVRGRADRWAWLGSERTGGSG